MTPQQFGLQLERLKVLYSEKNFPEERVKVMWARYGEFPAKAFELAVDWVVLSMPSPGAVVSVLDEKLHYAKKETHSSAQPQYQFACPPCRDFGWVFEGDLIVHCTCEKSKSVSWDELKRQQENYERGKVYFPREKLAAIFEAARKNRGRIA